MPVSQDERTRKVQITLTNAQNARLNRVAKRSGVTKSAIIRVALEREFALDDLLDRECSRSPVRTQKRKKMKNQLALFKL
jgi:hypothetical protein